MFPLACYLLSLRRSPPATARPTSIDADANEPSDYEAKATFATVARPCENGAADAEGRFYRSSEQGEDRDLMGWFRGLCGGTYIEIGALDGVTKSNSHVFNKSHMRWRGVLIELIEENYRRLVKNRPDEIATVHAGVCETRGVLHSVANNPAHRPQQSTGGIFEFASPSFAERWWGGTTLEEIRAGDAAAYVSEIECDTLDGLLLRHAGDVVYYDFLSLDVEGGELEVLRSVNFGRVGFGVVFVEADEHNRTKNREVRTLMASRGYNLVGKKRNNDWFVNDRFGDIYGGIIERPPNVSSFDTSPIVV